VRVEASFVRLGEWMLVLSVVFGLGATAAWVVGGRIVRQVGAMATTVREITAASDLDRRLAVGSDDEVGALAQSFNSLLEAQQLLSRERAQAARRDKERADAIEAAYADLRRTTEELHKSQQKLIEADKLATVGQLAAGVAHEINNPAASVLGNLEFIQGALPSLVVGAAEDPASKETLTDVNESLADSIAGLERMALIVRDLGAFARRSDEMELLRVTEPIDVALKMANFELRYRAQVVREYEPVPPIAANRGRLQQVFLNLLINAAHAMPRGQVANHQLRVAARREDGFVRVDVSDSGSGIAPENLTRIFDPFFTTKPSGHGTGLGLAITNDIVHQHGGAISVASELGKGTTFTLRFPVAQPADQ
jgi:signal transduction histidine kinase